MKMKNAPKEAKAAAGVVRIPKALDARLTKLAEKTGRAKSYYARKALEQYLEDTEDYLIAIERLKKPMKRYTSAQVRAMLGLDD